MSGAGWDALGAAALAAPLAGLAAPLAGSTGRRSIARAGRWGAVAAVAAWVVLLCADAAPEFGAFTPDPLAMAAAAGAALLAAVVMVDPAVGEPPGLSTILASPAAALAGLVVGALDPPAELSRLEATTMVLGGAALAATAVAVAVGGPRRAGVPVTAVAISPALFLSLRGAAELTEPMAVAGLAALVAATACAGLASRRSGGHELVTVTACLLVAAVALGPVPDARRWAPLVAAGVLVVATGAGRWTVVALAPGVVAVVTAIADVPAAGDPSRVAHVAFAAGLAATVAGVVIGGRPPETAATPAGARPKSEPADEERSPISIEVRAVVVTLTAWLLLAPGSWRWAVGDAQALAGWDRAAAVAAATGLIVGGLATVAARPDRAPPTAARYP